MAEIDPKYALAQSVPGNCPRCKKGRVVHTHRLPKTIYTGVVTCRGCGYSVDFIVFIGDANMKVLLDEKRDQLHFRSFQDKEVDVE